MQTGTDSRCNTRNSIFIQNSISRIDEVWVEDSTAGTAGLFLTHSILDACEQVMQEQRIGPCLVGVTESGIERAAAVEVVIPGHWVIVAVSSAGVGGLVDPDEDVDIGVEIFKIV
jgi:hypothetical protein